MSFGIIGFVSTVEFFFSFSPLISALGVFKVDWLTDRSWDYLLSGHNVAGHT